MDEIEKIKSQNLLEYIQKCFGQQGKKEIDGVRFKSGNEKTASLLVYKDNNKGYCDFSGKLGAGTIIDFYINYFGVEKNEAIKNLKKEFGINSEKKEFEKQPKRSELIEKFEKYKLSGLTPLIRLLMLRGFTHEQIVEYGKNVEEVAKQLGFFQGLWIKEKIYKDVIIFPCYNEKKEIIGGKLRTLDGSKFENKNGEIKSHSILKTGFIYDDISDDYVIITEGEIDYINLRILGFKSVIGNLGGVQSHKEMLKKIIKNTKKIICFYDNDNAGQQALKTLKETLNRPLRIINFPIFDGKIVKDVNDLFNCGYGYNEFQQLIDNAELQEEIEENEKENQVLYKNRFFYNNTKMEYFDIKDFSFKTGFSLARHLFIKGKELEDLRMANIIPSYDGMCYYDGGKEGFYNLLDKSQILTPSKNPKIHELIEQLLVNICNTQENYEWLLQAILYKYTHLNDVYIPAVILFGFGGSGKGLFLKLLNTIFGNSNVQTGLTQDNIEGRFSAYTGQKLIVEFKEISVTNTEKGKRNMNKLKTFIMEDTISIEKKGQDVISIENIAWFIMSSNEGKPVHLDSSISGNRRFSIINTGGRILNGKEIEQIVTNKEFVSDFLAYLFYMFPNIPNAKIMHELNNEEKRALENISESVGNLFFQRFEEKYPHINKLTTEERNLLVNIYRTEIAETEYDERYKIQYFNSGLSSKYFTQIFRKNDKICRGYIIRKDVKGDGFFPDGYIQKKILEINNNLF